MSKQNQIQIGGTHYKTGGEEHWDRVHRLGLDYFQAAITKYVERCWKKNGVQDLEKARHFLDKYIELNSPSREPVAFVKVDEMVVQVGDVSPTGWRGFVFEGADAEGFLYTCRACRASLRIPPDDNPHAYHTCPPAACPPAACPPAACPPAEEPGSGYVNQD